MNHTSNDKTTATRNRRRRWRRTNIVALLALCVPQAAHAFTKVSTKQRTLRRSDSSVLFFRTGGLEGAGTATFSSGLLSPALLEPTTETTTTRPTPATNHLQTHMPIWLQLPKGHLTERNLQQLQTALRDSYFTENEALKILFAIEEAAGNDKQKIAGAAEFLLLLLATMELGLHALVAAAFHYCSCVTAREQQSTVLTERFHMSSFGDAVVSIARDSARLKQLEMVASRVVEQKQQHEEEDAENLLMLLLSESKDWRGLAIRSAACLYRLRGLLESPQHLQQDRMDPEKVRVAREALWIYAPIASRLGMHRLKNELEGSAFQILYKKQYDRLALLTHERETPNGPTVQEEMNQVLFHVQQEMTEMLEQDEQFSDLVQDFTVTARVKEPYSMWRKMLSHGYQHIYQVPDALALRIVLNAAPLSEDEPHEMVSARERALCYYAQQLCTERWKPQPHNPRFKDYIEKPKPNGYQSLHYTAKTRHNNKDWSVEIQTRSGEMHRVAEFGLASHWDYKEQQKKSSNGTAQLGKHSTNESFANDYLRKVQQWHWEQTQGGAPVSSSSASSGSYSEGVVSVDPWLEANDLDDLWQMRVKSDRIRTQERLQPYIESLTNAQSDLARDFVFVFWEPHGSVVKLPAGACVVDALRKGCINGAPWQERSSGARCNGLQTAYSRRLSNGDVLNFVN